MNTFVASLRNPGFLGFWSWNVRTGDVCANPQLAQYFGVSVDPDGRSTMNSFELRIHPEDIEWLRRERLRSIGPSGHGAVEYRVLDEAGEVHWVMCRGVYLTDQDGEILEGWGMMMDVTAFKADGNSVRTAPAPLPHPIQTLIDSTLEAHKAATQIGNAEITRSLETVLMASARLLSERLLNQVGTQH